MKLLNYFHYIAERQYNEEYEAYLLRKELERLQVSPLICESSVYSAAAEQEQLEALDLQLQYDDDMIRFRRK